jgi:hypothetical protein
LGITVSFHKFFGTRQLRVRDLFLCEEVYLLSQLLLEMVYYDGVQWSEVNDCY